MGAGVFVTTGTLDKRFFQTLTRCEEGLEDCMALNKQTFGIFTLSEEALIPVTCKTGQCSSLHNLHLEV